MIHVVPQPDERCAAEVRSWLDGRVSSRGAIGDADACGDAGELDPRWLLVLRDALGHQPYVVQARSNGAASSLRGYLPMALVRSRLFGRFLVSLPYLNRAGVVADDEETAGALVDRAIDLGRELNVQYVELRHSHPVRHDALPDARNEKVRMVRHLPASPETLWADLTAKVRNQVRKGQKHDLEIRWGGGRMVRDFYRVFSQNMRDLGTPVYPRRLFESILTHFADRAELGVVDFAGRPVAAALLIHAPAGTQVPSASTLRAFNFTCANMWLYHRLQVRAIERGSRQFDFGRSSEGSGTYRFKQQWGASPHPTSWQYHVRRGTVGDMRPDNPRHQWRIAAWRKLPVWLTRVVGPRIVRGIP